MSDSTLGGQAAGFNALGTGFGGRECVIVGWHPVLIGGRRIWVPIYKCHFNGQHPPDALVLGGDAGLAEPFSEMMFIQYDVARLLGTLGKEKLFTSTFIDDYCGSVGKIPFPFPPRAKAILDELSAYAASLPAGSKLGADLLTAIGETLTAVAKKSRG